MRRAASGSSAALRQRAISNNACAAVFAKLLYETWKGEPYKRKKPLHMTAQKVGQSHSLYVRM